MSDSGVAATDPERWQRILGFDLSWHSMPPMGWTVTVHGHDGLEHILVEHFSSGEEANAAAIDFIEGRRS